MAYYGVLKLSNNNLLSLLFESINHVAWVCVKCEPCEALKSRESHMNTAASHGCIFHRNFLLPSFKYICTRVCYTVYNFKAENNICFLFSLRYGINVEDSHAWPCKTIYLYLHISKSTMFGLIKHFYINTASTLQLLNLNNEIKMLKVYLYWTALFVVDCMICMLFSHRS
jgi:hypothetical protein